MSNHRFMPRSKGPRKVASVAPYDRLAESYGVCSKTGRIRRQNELVGHDSTDLRIEQFRRFKQVAGEVRRSSSFREVGFDRPGCPSGKTFTDKDGRTWNGSTFRVEVWRDADVDKPLTLAKARSGSCRCKAHKEHTGLHTATGAVTKTVYDRRGCPIHDSQSKAFRRLVCQCGTSFVPHERHQDCCQACWSIGETPSARIFGPDSARE